MTREEALAKRALWREQNREKLRKEAREYYCKNKEIIKEKTKIKRQLGLLKESDSKQGKIKRNRVRNKIIDALGSKCVVCSENNKNLLVFHHKNGNGNQERKKIGVSGTKYYRHVFKNLKDYELLCCNHHFELHNKNATKMSHSAQLRLKVINLLGGYCVSCKTDNIDFLQVDHVFNDGYIEKKKFKNCPSKFYTNILNNIDSNKYQVLCTNCNWLKHIQGGN